MNNRDPDYPRMMFSRNGWVIVHSEAEEAALGPGWSRKVYAAALEPDRKPLPKPQPPPEPEPEPEEQHEEEPEKPAEPPQEHHKTPVTRAPAVKKHAAHARAKKQAPEPHARR